MDEWIFTATVTMPGGRTVTSTVTVPVARADDDVLENAELASLGAVQAVRQQHRADEYRAKHRPEVESEESAEEWAEAINAAAVEQSPEQRLDENLSSTLTHYGALAVIRSAMRYLDNEQAPF